MAGENSYRPSIDQAVNDIGRIEEKLGELAEEINRVGKLAKENLGSLTPKTPADLDKGLKQVKKALDDIAVVEKQVGDAMSKRMDLIRDNATKQSMYSKQHIKDQEFMLKQTNKAANILKKQAIEEKKVKEAREASISKQMTGRMVEYVNSIGRTNDELIKMKLYYKELSTELNKAAVAEDKVKQAREKALSKEWTGRMRESVDAIGKQSQSMKALNADYKEWERSSAKEAQQKEKAIRATEKLGGAYKQLVAKQQQAKKVLQDLIVLKGRSNKETRAAQREYNKYTKEVNRANAAANNFAKGGLNSAMRGVSNLMGAFGLVGGLYIFADMTRQGFRLAKQLDSLNFAMETVITNEEELALTRAFLSDITERYGASLVTTTERYTKFRAAAMQSNVSMEDTQQIFGSMTKAAGALGLQTHELEGVFLALEQMLSKGKVTTEELRRQLGERLPGAFGIMADALGVTVGELDSMLRKGEILSAEALPKFAKAAEKAYGIENLTRVENLNAATTRLSNAWVDFVQTLTNSEGAVSKTLVGIVDSLAKAMKGIDILVSTTEELEMKQNNRIKADAYTAAMNEIKTAAERTGKSIEEVAAQSVDAYDEQVFSIKEQIKALEDRNTVIQAANGHFGYTGEYNKNKEELEELNTKLATYQGMLEAAVKLEGESAGVKEEIIDRGRTYADVLADIEEQQNKLNDSLQEEAPAIHARIAALKEEAAAWELNTEKKKENAKATKEVLEGSVAAFEEVKRELQDQQNRLATTTEEWKDYEEQIQKVEDRIKFLKEGIEGFDMVSELSPSGIDMGGDDDNWSERTKAQIEQANELKAMRLAIEESTLEGLKELYDDRLQAAIDSGASDDEIDALKEQQDRRLEVVKDALQQEKELREDFQEAMRDLVVEGADAIMEARVENVEEDIALNKERYATILDSQEWSEEQRSAIEAERDRKEAELEKKKRKREKEAFLVRQGFALAEIGINLATTLSAIDLAVAQIMATLPFPFNVAAAGTYKASATTMAIGTAAASAGLILAQTIPKFEKGTDNAPEGVAWVDEKRPEVHTDKHGNVKSWGNDGANLRFLERGDKVFKSRPDFFKQYNQEELQKAVWNMNLQSNGEILSQKQVDDSLLREISGLKQSNEKVWREVKKLAGRPINNNVKVTIDDRKPY